MAACKMVTTDFVASLCGIITMLSAYSLLKHDFPQVYFLNPEQEPTSNEERRNMKKKLKIITKKKAEED